MGKQSNLQKIRQIKTITSNMSKNKSKIKFFNIFYKSLYLSDFSLYCIYKTILFVEREYCPSYCCSGRPRESGCRTDKLWCQRQCPVSGWSEPQDMNQQTQKHVDKKLNSFVLCCYFVFCRKVSVPCTWQHRRTTWKW